VQPYSGSGVYTNWASLAYGGAANPTMTGEQVAVVVDSVTHYSAAIEAMADNANWASGFTITLTFYQANGTQISAVNAISGTLVTGTHAVVATTPTLAPALSSYAVIQLQYNGSPAATNPLDIYKLALVTSGNANTPGILNFNYAFANGTWPWVPGNSAVLNSYSAKLSGTSGNPDSLVIGGVIELMGGEGGVPCQLPDLTDAASGASVQFRIATPGGQLQTLSGGVSGPYDLGDPQPTQDFVETLLLDGERPFGSRTSNRTMVIPVQINAPTQQTLNAARDYLLSVINQQEFEVSWTPAATGLTTIYKCFRALPSQSMYGFNNLREGVANNGRIVAPAIGLVTVNIQALPFGVSGDDGTVQIDFASNLVNGPPIASAVTLDDFSGTIDTADGWISNTQYPVLGSHAVFHRQAVPIVVPWKPAVYSRTGLTPANITGCPVLAVWLGQSYDTQWPNTVSVMKQVTISAVLTDSTGRTVSCKQTISNTPWSMDPNKPAWKQFSLPIPQNNPKFSYNAVTGYKLTVSNIVSGGQLGYVKMHAWLGLVTANPQTITNANSPRGVVYNVFGLAGSARSPVNAQIQLPNGDPVVQEYTKSGVWQVPSGVTSLTLAEAWGAGGAGASTSLAVGGGAGGGAEYAAAAGLSVQPGQKIPMTIGQGGTGAQLTPSTVTFSSTGHNSWTCPANVTTIKVETWGAGGAGAAGAGGGGGGEYSIKTSVAVTAGHVYDLWVGAGGTANTGKTAQANAARNGQNTWFGVSGNKYLTGALVGSNGGKSPLTGSAEGGLGGTGWSGATHSYRGGGGGRSPGAAGGGGGAGAANTGPGAVGGGSPKLGSLGGGDYLTGGPGGSGPGGPGGNGANAPGAATKGTAPGGGGGGGYTKNETYGGGPGSINYQGANGGAGQVIITYTVNSGSPVPGGNTLFGSAATTGTVVTAHGGLSAAINSGFGANGGSGSSNTTHSSGGQGGLSENNSNYLTRAANAFTIVATGSGTATTSFTSSASTSAANHGMLCAVIGSSAALLNETVSDSAGNLYYQVSSQLLSDNTWVGAYASTIKNNVTTSTTLNVANPASVSLTVAWIWNPNCLDIDDSQASVATSTGSSTSVTFPTYSNLDTSTIVQELCVLFNSNNQSPSGFAVAPASATLANVTNGALRLDAATRQIPGSSSALSWNATTFGSSASYGVLMIPFIMNNRQAQDITVGNSSFTGTSTTLTFGAQQPPLEASGYAYLRVQAAGAATIGVSDGVNTWSAIGNVAMGTSHMYVWGAPITTKLSAGASSVITITDGTSQVHTYSVHYIPGGTGLVSSTVATNTGTGTSATVTTPVSGTVSGTFQIFAVGNANTAATSGVSFSNSAVGALTPADVNGTLRNDGYVVQQADFQATTMTATYASSQTWGALTFAVAVPVVSGGGGSSAGPGGVGLDGVGGASGGAPSYTAGGHGANGVSGTGAGLVGATPGGGGGGAAGTGANQGGAGGSGLIRISHLPPLKPFNDFLLHRPGDGAPMDLNPLIPIPVSDPPDNREYSVPQTVAGRNAQFGGTYTVLLCNSSWNNSGTQRRISVTVNQYEYAGGPAVSVQATRTLTPDTDIINGYVTMGELTLPIKGVDMSNTDGYYTVSIHDTNQSDQFQDMIFLDTQGQTVIVNIAEGTAGDGQYSNYYIDEPGLSTDLGLLMGSSHERDRAISALDMAIATGGPFYVAPGDNILVAYSTQGPPNLRLIYSPRWFSDRIV
jgi:hypothetical protein